MVFMFYILVMSLNIKWGIFAKLIGEDNGNIVAVIVIGGFFMSFLQDIMIVGKLSSK
jgi:hypothetical protein